jgi:hypothetical protein
MFFSCFDYKDKHYSVKSTRMGQEALFFIIKRAKRKRYSHTKRAALVLPDAALFIFFRWSPLFICAP